jgi:hypothetical protein
MQPDDTFVPARAKQNGRPRAAVFAFGLHPESSRFVLGCKKEDTRLGLEWRAGPPIACADDDSDSDILQTDYLKDH